MIITLVRSGGFTGIPITKTIDTSKLPKNQKDKIENLIKETKESKVSKESKGVTRPDRFTYSISVGDSSIPQTLKISEETMDEKTRELIDTLETNS